MSPQLMTHFNLLKKCEQDSTLSMGSLDANSLFTNIPLDEFIDVCVNQFFENTDTVEGFTKSELSQLLSLATKESYFIFNGLLYKQIDGVAMGSPLGHSVIQGQVPPCLKEKKILSPPNFSHPWVPRILIPPPLK